MEGLAPILRCDGTTQYVENIQEGEWIWSRDSDTGEFGCREVVGLEVTPEQLVLVLEVSTSDNGSEIFGVTAEHPFRVVGEGWKSAGELKPGDAIFTSTGGWMRVTSSSWQAHTQTVYNFEVADFHTYFVGDGGAWVHNACQVDTVSKTRRGAFREAKRANNISMSAQPIRVITPDANNSLLRSKNIREYEFTNRYGEQIYIREDLPVSYPDGGFQGPHFNSGSIRRKLKAHHYWEEK